MSCNDENWPAKQEARKLWRRICSVQGFATDLALVAEAHALLAEQPSSKEALVSSTFPTADQNGSANGGEIESKSQHKVVLFSFSFEDSHVYLRLSRYIAQDALLTNGAV